MLSWIAKQAKRTAGTSQNTSGGVVSLGPPRPLNDTPQATPRSPTNIMDIWRGNVDNTGDTHDAGLPQKPAPVFKNMNMDRVMKGQNYMKKSVKHQPPAYGKENMRVYFSRDVSPVGSPATGTSRVSSAPESAIQSRRHSRSPSVQQLYKRKKYPAPCPPNTTSGASSAVLGRKKRRAPPPPKTPSTPRSQTPPAEPPVDYDDEDNLQIMEVDEKVSSPPAQSILPPPPIMVTPPSPLPPRVPTPPPPPPPVTDPVPLNSSAPKHSVGLHRLNSALQKDIILAAERRAEKGPVDITPKKSAQELFTQELRNAFAKRMARLRVGTIRVQRTPTRRVFRARVATHTMILRRLQSNLATAETEDDADHRDSAIERPDEEWMPAQDLDDDSSDEDSMPTVTLTSRSGDYYETIGQKNSESKETPGQDVIKLYKKKKYAKRVKTKERFGTLHKFKKSLKSALGSISRNSNGVKERGQLMNVFSEMEKTQEGWEVYHAEDYDKPPKTPIKVKQVEKRPLYAYNNKTGQLIMMPQQEKIYITTDGLRIHQDALMNSNTSIDLLESEGLTDKEKRKMSLSTETRERLEEEKQEQKMMELKFEQVRYLNKKFMEEEDPSSTPTDSSPTTEPEAPVLPKEKQHKKPREKNKSKKSKEHKSKSKVLPTNHQPSSLDVKRNPVFSSDDDEHSTESDQPNEFTQLEDSGYYGGLTQAQPIYAMQPHPAYVTGGMPPIAMMMPSGSQIVQVPTAFVPQPPVPGDISYSSLPRPYSPGTYSTVNVRQTAQPGGNVPLAEIPPQPTAVTVPPPISAVPPSAQDYTTASLERQRRLIMGPIGFRPVHFNPNPRAPPVTLPVRSNSTDSGLEVATTPSSSSDTSGSPLLDKKEKSTDCAHDATEADVILTAANNDASIPLEDEGLVAL